MKLFKNILKRTEPKKKKTLPWIPLNKNEQLKEIVGLVLIQNLVLVFLSIVHDVE